MSIWDDQMAAAGPWESLVAVHGTTGIIARKPDGSTATFDGIRDYLDETLGEDDLEFLRCDAELWFRVADLSEIVLADKATTFTFADSAGTSRVWHPVRRAREGPIWHVSVVRRERYLRGIARQGGGK